MTNFKVMLAHPVGKKEFDKDSFIQPKLDGVRCYITYHGALKQLDVEREKLEGEGRY